ncbi:mannitol 1-phosphate dehydrogenase [Trichoderma gamsii]|uniref:Mannitol 1-phosphate dehydrogenase n=1 Tax=Trichoderma gamsii TaxID=398673 RepID=A0A2K0SYA1_9HYPO|nr:mannitol 1-phosphate dehydrogenase [Trichoderma gamsii]PNP38259.1 hypothetical protein TGAMA5MH_09832 [Trichoderma gamsii]PON26136.1 mannitol 1-phosphate dehydrogenase [Trichoderma gamsii]
MAIGGRSTAAPDTFSVAILGGGIGGLAMALSLTTQVPSLKNITVYEQAPAYKEIGAGIGIGVNASRILKRYGVYDAANAISGDRNGIHRSLRRWDNGDEIVSVGAMDEEASNGGVRQLSVHRAELLQVLYEHLRDTTCAKLETDKRAVEIIEDQKGGKAVIHFADGTHVSADLVIACDGIHSNVRRQFSKGNDLMPRYSGRVCYRGLLPMSAVEEDWPYDSFAVSWLGPSRHFLVFPISQNKTLNVVAFVSKTEAELGALKESWSSTAPRSEVEAEFSGWDETVQKVVRAMEPRPGKWKLNDRELLDQWVYLGGKVVLGGDAAHAMLPHQGSGAGHAIEDSFVMGQALKAFFENPSAGLETYMKLYQETRLPRAQRAQLTSRQAGDGYEMQGPEFAGLVFEQRLQVIHDKFKDRMTWVWGHDLEADFNATRTRLGL